MAEAINTSVQDQDAGLPVDSHLFSSISVEEPSSFEIQQIPSRLPGPEASIPSETAEGAALGQCLPSQGDLPWPLQTQSAQEEGAHIKNSAVVSAADETGGDATPSSGAEVTATTSCTPCFGEI